MFSSCMCLPGVTGPDNWPEVLDRAGRAVVMLKINTVRCFETNTPAISISTGFVVDKRLGIILTNRHVVQAGPIVGKASFVNNEEVQVAALYRDPEHDFAFLKYDPRAVRHMAVGELQLYPEGAILGTEIRVIGSDAGEKLMVLAGTLAQDSRECPQYSGFYQDVNSFYLASSSSTSGGSSGAPVLDSKGRVIGLNAGAAVMAASSFFLPLDRIVHALNALRENKPITRGTLLTVFSFVSMDECRRLGLTREDEKKLRHQQRKRSAMGALVISRVIDGGAGHSAGLETGDILIKMGGSMIASFSQLETALDGNIGKEITVVVQRGNSLVETVAVPQDLSSFLPSRLVEYSGGVVHNLGTVLSYPTGVHPSAVVVAHPGYSMEKAGIPIFSVLTSIDGELVKTLGDFARIMASKLDRQRIVMRFYSLARKGVEHSAIVVVDRKWFPLRIMIREDAVLSRGITSTMGLWKVENIESVGSSAPSLEARPFDGTKDMNIMLANPHVQDASTLPDDVATPINSVGLLTDQNKREQAAAGVGNDVIPLDTIAMDRQVSSSRITLDQVQQERSVSVTGLKEGENALKGEAKGRIEDLLDAFVYITCDCPFRIDGIADTKFVGCGVILDADLGLVWCDRRTVVSCLGDIRMVFGGVLEIDSCRVVYFHPTLNFGLIRFDVSDLKGRKIKALECFAPKKISDVEIDAFGARDIRPGDSLTYVGLTRQRQVQMIEKTIVLSIERCSVETPRTPCFAAKNFDRIEFDKQLPSTSINGVYVDSNNVIRAFASYFFLEMNQADALLSSLSGPVKTALDQVRRFYQGRQEGAMKCYTLGVELGVVRLGEAKEALGLHDLWFDKLARAADEDLSGAGRSSRDALKVFCLMAGTPPAKKLLPGDLILEVDGKPAVSYQLFDDAATRAGENGAKVRIRVLREREEVEVECVPFQMSALGTQRIVKFCGMQVQETHPHVLFSGFLPSFLRAEKDDDAPFPGVYVSCIDLGSPAEASGIYAPRWVQEMDEKPIRSLHDFMNIVKTAKQGNVIRMVTVGLDGEEEIHALDVDAHYFPLMDLHFDSEKGLWSLKT